MTKRVIALAVVSSALVSSQPSRPHTLTVSVVRADGRVAADLTPRDFLVEVSGVPVPVAVVNTALEPMSVLLLFDRSGSVLSVPLSAASPFATGGRGALLGVDAVGDGILRRRQSSDREYLGRFSGYTEFRGPISPDQAAWEQVLAWGLARVSGGSSPIWDAASEAAMHIARDPGRKLLVLVTDGRSNGNVLSLEDAARQIVRSGVAVSVIDVGYREQVRQLDQMVAIPRPDRLLMWLTEATGGHYITDATVLRTRTVPGSLLENIIARHRHAYRIVVDIPAGLAAPQSVKVRVNRADTTVRTAAFIEVR